MKKILWVFLIGILFISCQKKLPTDISKQQPKPPDEPLQRLAWDAAQQIAAGVGALSMKLGTIENRASLPDSSLHYFRGALENELWRTKPEQPVESTVQVNGIVTYANGQLQFLWETLDQTGEKITGMSAILWSPPKDIDSTQDHSHHTNSSMSHHKEVEIPTPIAHLESPPLDVNQICSGGKNCDLVILYEDSIERIDWKEGTKRRTSIPSEYFSQTRSRSPSGKILYLDGAYTVLHNNLSHPLQYDSDFDHPVPGNIPTYVPRPATGFNIFLLMNGRFYDFEVLSPKGIAVIQDDLKLSVGAGTLVTATEQVGSALAALWPVIYTSSPSLPGQQDALLKFNCDNSSINFISTVPVEGEILDIAATDLNQDGSSELLVTIRTKNGIIVDVMEAF